MALQSEPLDKNPAGWDEKPLPLTVSVKLAPPAAVLLGDIEVIVGDVVGVEGGGDGGDGDDCVELPPPQLASSSDKTKSDTATMLLDLMTPSLFTELESLRPISSPTVAPSITSLKTADDVLVQIDKLPTSVTAPCEPEKCRARRWYRPRPDCSRLR